MSENMSNEVFRLSDLLAHEQFGLKLISGDQDAPQRAVSGIHTVESESPTEWLAPSWIMLTIGMRLRGRPTEQRALIAELDEARVSALGFAVGVFKQVPKALVEEAQKREFPVFVVPYTTTFRDMTTFANRSLLSSDLRLFQRLSSIQRYLVDALRERKPEESLVRRLSSVIDADVLLVGIDGTVQLSTGSPPVAEILTRLRSRKPDRGEHEIGDYRFMAGSIEGAETSSGWLVFGRRRTKIESPLATAVLQVATPLFAAVEGLREASRLEDYAAERQLLEEILTVGTEGNGSVAARAAAHGVKFARSGRIVSIRPEQADHIGDAERALRDALRVADAPHIVASRPDSLVALVELERPQLDRVLEPLASGSLRCMVGLGRPIGEPSEAGESLRDAELTLDRLRDEPPAVVAFEDLDLVTLLLAQAPSKRLGQKVDAILEALQSQPSVYNAVVAYLRNELSVNDTAKALFLHPNTIRYRLGKAEELLGRSIRDPSTLVDIQIALVASGAIGQAPEH